MDNVPQDIVNIVLNFLENKEVYLVVTLTSKKINKYIGEKTCSISCTTTSKFELLAQRIEKLKIDHITLNYMVLNDSKWQKLQHVKKSIEMYDCRIDDIATMTIPRKIQAVSVHDCLPNEVAKIIHCLDKSNVKKLEIFLAYEDGSFHSDDICDILKLGLTELSLLSFNETIDCKNFSHRPSYENSCESDHFKKIEKLELDGFNFGTETKNTEGLKYAVALKTLNLVCCQISDDQILNAISCNLVSLSLRGTKITDSFTKKLSELKIRDKKLCLKTLDISQTKITSESIEHLNSLYLEELVMDQCELDCLNGIDMQLLTNLSLRDNDLCDTSTTEIFDKCPKLKILTLSFNKRVTARTLSELQKRNIKLDELWLYGTNVNVTDVMTFLKDAKLKRISLKCSRLYYDMLIQAGIVLSRNSIRLFW